jgi:hypothetical protein
MKNKALILLIPFIALGLFYSGIFAQTCNQPGALLSVKNSFRNKTEYIVFTFIDPYNSKGDLFKASGPFIQLPSLNSIVVQGVNFFKITFNNTFSVCDTKNYYIVPQEKVIDIKPIQHSAGVITYVIGLAKDAIITSHSAYNYHGFHIVKLRIE